MQNNQNFSRAELFAAIQQAEDLAQQVDTMPEGQEQMRLIYRWAEVVDGVAKSMVQAEELLPKNELRELQAEVNAQDENRWEKYRRNIKWMNQPAE